jgi:tetratricopeptide (TPR) repeat protein
MIKIVLNFLLLAALIFSKNIYAGQLIDKLKTGVNIAEDAVTLFKGVLDFIDSKEDISKSIEYKNDTISVKENNTEPSTENKKLSDDFRQLAWARAKSNDHLAALPAYRRSLELDANNASSWHGYGWSLSELGLYDQAKNAFLISLKLRKSDESWRYLGWNYERQDLLNEAKESYVEALVLNRNNKKAQYAIDHLNGKPQKKNKISWYAIQTAAFTSENSAQLELQKIKTIFNDSQVLQVKDKHCVLIGNYPTKGQAIEAKIMLEKTHPEAKDFYV